MASSFILNNLSQVLSRRQIHKSNNVPIGGTPELIVIISGSFALLSPKGEIIENLEQSSICREETILFPKLPISTIAALTEGEYGVLPGFYINEIPSVIWKLFEIYELRQSQIKVKKKKKSA